MSSFKSLADFNRHLEKVVADTKARKLAILDVAAQYVEDDSKRKFGVYQRSDTGTFEPWQELSEATKADRERKGFEPNNPLYRTGGLMESIRHEVSPTGNFALVGSDDPVMLYQEKGTPNAAHPIPPRSVLGIAAFQSKKMIQKIAGEGMMAWIMNKPIIKRRY